MCSSDLDQRIGPQARQMLTPLPLEPDRSAEARGDEKIESGMYERDRHGGTLAETTALVLASLSYIHANSGDKAIIARAVRKRGGNDGVTHSAPQIGRRHCRRADTGLERVFARLHPLRAVTRAAGRRRRRRVGGLARRVASLGLGAALGLSLWLRTCLALLVEPVGVPSLWAGLRRAGHMSAARKRGLSPPSSPIAPRRPRSSR